MSKNILNKVYYFDDGIRDYGMFIAAETWKEARSFSLTGDYDMLADISFIEIRGSLVKKEGKLIFTEYHGQLERHQMDELGIDYMWVEE